MVAAFFRFLFKSNFFRKRYFGIQKKIFDRYNLFKSEKVINDYDGNIKMNLSLKDWIQKQIYFLGYYDKIGIDCLKHHVKNGDVFIDIGANIGSYSLIASKEVGESGKVIAFEPINSIYSKLKKNIELNEAKNIEILPLAVYNEKKQINLFCSNLENEGMSSIIENDQCSGKIETVEAIKLDNFINENNIQKVDFIKIDIEGAELPALQGMVETITKNLPLVLIEISESVLTNAIYSADDIINFFKNHNYQLFQIKENGFTQPLTDIVNTAYTNYLFKPIIK